MARTTWCLHFICYFCCCLSENLSTIIYRILHHRWRNQSLMGVVNWNHGGFIKSLKTANPFRWSQSVFALNMLIPIFKKSIYGRNSRKGLSSYPPIRLKPIFLRHFSCLPIKSCTVSICWTREHLTSNHLTPNMNRLLYTCCLTYVICCLLLN